MAASAPYHDRAGAISRRRQHITMCRFGSIGSLDPTPLDVSSIDSRSQPTRHRLESCLPPIISSTHLVVARCCSSRTQSGLLRQAASCSGSQQRYDSFGPRISGSSVCRRAYIVCHVGKRVDSTFFGAARSPARKFVSSFIGRAFSELSNRGKRLHLSRARPRQRPGKGCVK